MLIRVNLLHPHHPKRPRYQQLQKARGTLASSIEYVETVLGATSVENIAAIGILSLALHRVKSELRHPERFNRDGSERLSRMYNSAEGGPAVGSFPPTEGLEKASRQLRRRLARTTGFNQMSFPRTTEVIALDENGKEVKSKKTGRTSAMPRGLRRAIAKGAKFPEQTNDKETLPL